MVFGAAWALQYLVVTWLAWPWWAVGLALGLLLKPPPFADSDISITIVWSDLRSGDPVLAWFRTLLAEEAAALAAEKRTKYDKTC